MADEATPRTPAERAAVLDVLRRARAGDDAAARRRRDQLLAAGFSEAAVDRGAAGARVLGGPIGSDVFVRAYCERVFARISFPPILMSP